MVDGLFLLLIKKVVVIIYTGGNLSALRSCLFTLFNALFIDTFDKIGHLFLALCTVDLLCGFFTRTDRSLVFFLPLSLFLFNFLLFVFFIILLFQLFSNRLSFIDDIKIRTDKIIYRQLIDVLLLCRLCGNVVLIF